MISTLEILPDEILLDICRYLHSGDVLYALYNLNARLNRTVTSYCEHVSFHQTFYLQCEYLCKEVVPRMDYLIQSLIICELESPLFERTFQTHGAYINLEKITFVNWTDTKLVKFLSNLHDLEQLRKFIIKSFNVTGHIDHRRVLGSIFGANENRLTSVCFNAECDWLDLTVKTTKMSNGEIFPAFPNLLELEIELERINDFYELIEMIPSVEYIHASFKDPRSDQKPIEKNFPNLKKLSIYSMSHFMQWENFHALMKMVPTVETLLLVIITRDARLIDQKELFNIMPLSVTDLNFSMCLQGDHDRVDITSKSILQSWSSRPVSLITNEKHRRSFFYTVPYPYHRLALRSSYHQSMINTQHHCNFNKIQHLHIYDTIALAEALPIIQQCRRVVDLYISISRRIPGL